jgi:two-component system, OmpR family, response regulator
MIVDDDKDLNYVLGLYVEKKGFVTIGLSSIDKMLGKLVEINPEVIFLDNHLDDGLGINFIKQVKDLCPGTLLILMTADHLAELRLCKDFDCLDGVLLKPFPVESVNEILARLAA